MGVLIYDYFFNLLVSAKEDISFNCFISPFFQRAWIVDRVNHVAKLTVIPSALGKKYVPQQKRKIYILRQSGVFYFKRKASPPSINSDDHETKTK